MATISHLDEYDGLFLKFKCAHCAHHLMGTATRDDSPDGLLVLCTQCNNTNLVPPYLLQSARSESVSSPAIAKRPSLESAGIKNRPSSVTSARLIWVVCAALSILMTGVALLSPSGVHVPTALWIQSFGLSFLWILFAILFGQGSNWPRFALLALLAYNLRNLALTPTEFMTRLPALFWVQTIGFMLASVAWFVSFHGRRGGVPMLLLWVLWGLSSIPMSGTGSWSFQESLIQLGLRILAAVLTFSPESNAWFRSSSR